jgi:hypothetical protein
MYSVSYTKHRQTIPNTMKAYHSNQIYHFRWVSHPRLRQICWIYCRVIQHSRSQVFVDRSLFANGCVVNILGAAIIILVTVPFMDWLEPDTLSHSAKYKTTNLYKKNKKNIRKQRIRWICDLAGNGFIVHSMVGKAKFIIFLVFNQK